MDKNNSSQITVFNFNDELSSFCEREKFKNYVKAVINDDYYKEVLLRSNIISLVEKELDIKIPKIKTKINKLVPNLVELKLNTFSQQQLPNLVLKEVCNQIPNFLNNNNQMQQILTHHSNNLNNMLQESATQTLNKVVNEEQYHNITSLHMNSMQQKCDNKLYEIDINLNNKIGELYSLSKEQLTNNDNMFKNQLEKIKNEVSIELKELHDGLNKLDKLNKKIIKIEQHNSSMRWLMGSVTVLFTGLMGVGIYYLTKR